jgi:predicted PurR-regulated permease PerM
MLRLVRSPSLAAALATTFVMLVLIVPAVVLGAAIVNEAGELYAALSEKTAQEGGWGSYLAHVLEKPLQWVGRYVDVSNFDLRRAVLNRLQQISAFLLAEAGALAGNLTAFIVNLVITLFTLFFLFREGKAILRRMGVVLPLSSSQYERLVNGISNTIIATVYGGLAVAAAQGALTGLALWACGIRSPVLWGVVASFFALIPLIGSAAVWLPAALFLILSGHWVKGVLLIAWGAAVVGTVDNILRPYLMGEQMRMHTLLIFFAVLGGVQVFGFLGLFVGPVVLAFTITLLGILRDEGRTWMSGWRDEPPPQPPINDHELAQIETHRHE